MSAESASNAEIQAVEEQGESHASPAGNDADAMEPENTRRRIIVTYGAEGMEDSAPAPSKDTVDEEADESSLLAEALFGEDPEPETANVCADPNAPQSEPTSQLSRASLEEAIASLLEGRDLAQLSMGKARKELEEHFGLAEGSLVSRRDEIVELVTLEITKIQTEPAEAAEVDGPETPQKSRHNGKKHHGKHAKKTHRRKRSRAEAEGSVDSEVEDAAVKPGDAGATPGDATTFLDQAKPLCLSVGGSNIELPAKRFASGSCGFYTNERVLITVDGVQREAQCQVNLAIIGSREWSK